MELFNKITSMSKTLCAWWFSC